MGRAAVSAAVIVVGCTHAATPPPAGAPRRPHAAVAPEPRSASYDALDGRYHYLAVVRVDPYEEHYLATFHHIEGGFYELAVGAAGAVRIAGGGFPSDATGVDQVPAEHAARLPALRAAVRTEEPEASSIGVTYLGTYQAVLLEEEIPCAGRHGNAYMQVELQLDAAQAHVVGQRFLGGSDCGAAPFYWASAHPRWLPITTQAAVLAPRAAAIPADVEAAVIDVVTHPDLDRATPPPVAEP